LHTGGTPHARCRDWCLAGSCSTLAADRTVARMVSRHGLLIGLGFALASAPAIAQVPQSTPATATPSSQPPAQAAPARRVTATQVTPAQRKPPPNTPAPVTTDPGVPHTLAEALAATYSTQPQLLAERAKLRATDENVPQALAGWRPTVVMAGTAGYGDGFDRAFSTTRGAFVNAQTDRLIGTAGDPLPADLHGRQDVSERQPRHEPGHG
jgi:hypothetical protein